MTVPDLCPVASRLTGWLDSFEGVSDLFKLSVLSAGLNDLDSEGKVSRFFVPVAALDVVVGNTEEAGGWIERWTVEEAVRPVEILVVGGERVVSLEDAQSVLFGLGTSAGEDHGVLLHYLERAMVLASLPEGHRDRIERLFFDSRIRLDDLHFQARLSMALFSVYGLVDPRSGVVRYVGMARDVGARLRTHQAKSHNLGVRSLVDELSMCGMQLEVRTLEGGIDQNQIRDRERYWIKKMGQSTSTPLLNVQVPPVEAKEATP